MRADCLRLKRWGSSAQWLEKNRPDLVQWLGSRQIVLVQPYYSYLSYRYVTEAGAWVTVDALIDQRLLRLGRAVTTIPGGWPPRAAMGLRIWPVLCARAPA